MNLHSYPQIFNLGHRAVADLLKGPVYVQEKIDGSQLSFGLINGELVMRSKGAPITIEAPQKMFQAAVDTCLALKPLLREGWTYRGEYLAKPKHNALAYDRIPRSHIILFDINPSEETYLVYDDVVAEAAILGLEVVPLLYGGMVQTIEEFRAFLVIDSILGGQKLEGVVVKPVGYAVWGQDKKCLMGKFVSEAFKEVHGGEWRKANPTNNDVMAIVAAKYATPARWQKAVIHLRERGLITDSPKDIGSLIKETIADTLKECEADIKQDLWAYAWEHISRKLTHGLPTWYKDELLKLQFEVK